MRQFATTFALFLATLTFSHPARASEDFDQAEASVHVAGYNRWVCYAVNRFQPWQRYWGYSHWFQAGSGQGQQAHTTAYQNALLQCRAFSRSPQCVSDFQRYCSVQRR